MTSGLLGKGGMPLSDGSWTLTVFVTDLQVERSLRVKGDLHIGGVMIRLVDDLGKTSSLNFAETWCQRDWLILVEALQDRTDYDEGVFRIFYQDTIWRPVVLGFRKWDSMLLSTFREFGESAFAYHVGVKCSQLRV